MERFDQLQFSSVTNLRAVTNTPKIADIMDKSRSTSQESSVRFLGHILLTINLLKNLTWRLIGQKRVVMRNYHDDVWELNAFYVHSYKIEF